MNRKLQADEQSGILVSRNLILRLLTFGLAENSITFLDKASEKWLDEFPGDLDVQLFSAYAMFAKGKQKEAYQKVLNILLKNPEQYAAWLSMTQIGEEKVLADAWGGVYALGGTVGEPNDLPIWSAAVRALRVCLKETDEEQMENFLNSVLLNSGNNPLIDVTHLRYALQFQSVEAVENLAQLYQVRWPDCLQFKIVVANQAVQNGDEYDGMQKMQEIVYSDPSGEITKSILGEDHAYRSFWPESQEIVFDLPIPIEIATRLGWNQLPSPEGYVIDDVMIEDLETELEIFENNINQNDPGSTNQNDDEKNVDVEIKNITKLFDRLSKDLGKKEEGRNLTGRYPTYVVVSSRSALLEKYGAESSEVVIDQLKALVAAIKQRPGWNALLFMPDDIELMAELGLGVVDTKDPWQIKLAITDLDGYLQEKGAMIGALLIAGGDDIIPYHRLPNPTDDSDTEIPSDNPYASVDANYFVPEWALGRLPGEAGDDPGLLLLQVRNAVKFHKASNKVYKATTSAGSFPFEMLIQFFLRLFGIQQTTTKTDSLGYSAAIWRRSAIAAYRPIGDANLVAVSPPTTSTSIDELWLSEVQYVYFNLHGVKEGSDWYGQKDYIDVSSGPDYPVALCPVDVCKLPKYSQVIFSEACYGAHVEGKQIDDSIALSFLSSGSKAFVGSTCIAYGSVQPPLIGADLLAYLFWKRMNEGYPMGEALMRAKVELAEEMQNRQGFLDGEDQKTLLSFVYYGDPLMIGTSEAIKSPKKIDRLSTVEGLMALSETEILLEEPMRVSKRTLNNVKKALSEYLPGLDDAELVVGQQFQVTSEELNTKFGPTGTPEKLKRTETGNVVMSFKKEINIQESQHQYYAKVTVDSSGKMVKLAVSR